MDEEKLFLARNLFLDRYPKGFNEPELIELGKKHKVSKQTQFCQEVFSKQKFSNKELILENIVKVISRASTVSMFEKPKFKDFVKSLSKDEKEILVLVFSILKEFKLAKWSLVTIIQSYYAPKQAVFIKPTTTKLILNKLDIKLEYNATPSWYFYKEYKKEINQMKKNLGNKFNVSNLAFCGFLMMTLEQR